MSDKSITMTMQQWSHVVSQSIQLAEAGKKCAAEREALRAEVERLTRERAQVETVLSHELSKALAEVERLKANAERYQWMRDSSRIGFELEDDEAVASVVFKTPAISLADFDAAIDAVRKAT